MSLDCSIIKVSCDCGYDVELAREHQKKIFGGDIRVADLSSFYNKFKCSKCDQKNPNVFDRNNNQLFDKKKLVKCESCQSFISIPRLDAKPDTTFCTPYCEYDLSYKTPAEEEMARKKREDFLKKDQLASKHNSQIENLMSKRFTVIDAFDEYKKNKISKSDYEKIFKKFTWWIKEEVERIGGKLVDNPTNYIDCPDCGNVTLVIWTPKFKKYFLGCSEYSNGCGWAKTIWKH